MREEGAVVAKKSSPSPTPAGYGEIEERETGDREKIVETQG